MSHGADYLDAITEALQSGKRQWRRGDNLLAAFGYVRRRQTAIDLINDELERRGLRTDPEVTTALPLEGYVTFYLAGEAGDASNDVRPQPTLDERRDAEEEALTTTATDVSLTVGNLEASELKPLGVSPDATIAEALTTMELHDYSQLVVYSGSQTVKGTVSFRSIARGQLTGEASHVRDCFDDPAVPHVSIDEPLLDVVAQFRSHDAVLVFRQDRSISGIVTPADIAAEFVAIAEPFLLIGEIERLLRWLILRRDVDLSLALRASGASESKEQLTPNDLTLGDLQRLVQHPEAWRELNVGYDQKKVCAELDRVRLLRNEVMHFREPLTPDDLRALRGFLSLLRKMCRAVTT